MTTTLTAEGLIEIPEEFRRADALKPGQRCEVERVGMGEYRVTVTNENRQGAMDWLLSCPEKGWFIPIEQTETTDDLKASPFA